MSEGAHPKSFERAARIRAALACRTAQAARDLILLEYRTPIPLPPRSDYASASGFSSSRNSDRNDAASVTAIARNTTLKVAIDELPRKL